MIASLIFRRESTAPSNDKGHIGGLSPAHIFAETPDEEIRAMAEHEQMEWEAGQGPNFKPLEDHEREEMINEYFTELTDRRNALKAILKNK
ncbi:hypothetical protein KJ657_02595 [Patescibacteria group bacterium]|nr:hypothetical protein [Patescibacteria group bacterium]MBU1015956.1 hypothetical protein [Patescibacteria group bacterium]MBU1685304.1 hypothetical protein [Patescibacteria group bacterium]MBU1939091.1 hypothetical protein [Patescibacteria group bacterium]